MDVPKDMCFWLYFSNFFQKLGATSVNSIQPLIQNLKRRPVSNQKIDVIGNDRPNLFSSCLMVLESPIKEKWLIWRSKYLQTFNFDKLMLEISAMLFEFLQLYFGIKFFMRMALWLVLILIMLDIINEIVIASDDYLVLVGKFVQKFDESVQLTSIAILRKVSRMDEYISFRQSRNIQVFVQVVGIAHSQYPDPFGIVHLLNIYTCRYNLSGRLNVQILQQQLSIYQITMRSFSFQFQSCV